MNKGQIPNMIIKRAHNSNHNGATNDIRRSIHQQTQKRAETQRYRSQQKGNRKKKNIQLTKSHKDL